MKPSQKFQGVRDLFKRKPKPKPKPKPMEEPLKLLTPEGKYRIKVLSVHANPDNIYNIQPTIGIGVNEINIGGKIKTKSTRRSYYKGGQRRTRKNVTKRKSSNRKTKRRKL